MADRKMNLKLRALIIIGLAACATPSELLTTRMEFSDTNHNVVAAILIDGPRVALSRRNSDNIIWLYGGKILDDNAYSIQVLRNFIITFNLSQCIESGTWEIETLEGQALQARCLSHQIPSEELPRELSAEGMYSVQLSGTPAVSSYMAVFDEDGALIGIRFLPDSFAFQEAQGVWTIRNTRTPVEQLVSALRQSNER